MRELWEPPAGPPDRPAGVPDRPEVQHGKGWLEHRSPGEGELSTRMVWAWIRGEWRDAGSVHAEGRTPSGWWLWVWWPSNPVWVHESATRPWAPTPEALAESRRLMRRPELPRDQLIALIHEEFGPRA